MSDEQPTYVTVKLNCGLGNRLFQIATGLGLARHWNCEFHIYESINLSNVHNKDLTKYRRFYEKFLKPGAPSLKTKMSINYYVPTANPVTFLKKKNTILFGEYFNYHNFEHIHDEIVEMFGPKPEEVEYLNTKYPDLADSYFFHVRLGDFLGAPFQTINLKKYYRHCFEQLAGKKVYVVTNRWDQLETMYPYLSDLPRIDENELNSLYAMSLCKKGGVMPHSTFSWWGFYLNTNPDKKCWMPSRWWNGPFSSQDLHLPQATIVPIRSEDWWWPIFLSVLTIMILMVIWIAKLSWQTWTFKMIDSVKNRIGFNS